MIDTNYKIATPLKDTENFDVSKFCGPFHDGEVYCITRSGDRIKIYMESFPLYFEDYTPPDPSPQYFRLTTENSYKGCLLLENVLDWSIDKKENCEFIHDYVWLEILDFEVRENEVDFLISKNFMKDEKMKHVWERYIFHANSIKWINFEHLNENEYSCEANKEEFFENILELMDKSQN